MSMVKAELLWYASIETPWRRRLWLAATERGLCAIELTDDEAAFVARLKRAWGRPPMHNEQALAAARRQLEEYMAGQRQAFDLPLDLRGLTPFQLDVLQATRAVPRGQTVSYKELARRVGRPAAVRAVGGVQAANPIPIIIPCHRIVGSNGSLTGYGGGIDMKIALLQLEGAMM